MNKNITHLKVGHKALVYKFSSLYWGNKLMSLGILPGQKIELVRTSLLGTEYYVEVGQQLFALRKSEAEAVEIFLTSQIL